MADDGSSRPVEDDALFAYDADELYENAPCGYVATKPDGTIMRANRTFLDWLGYRADEVVGTRIQAHLSLAGRIYHETHFAPLLRMQGAIREIALDFLRKDGERLPTLVNTVQRSGSDGAPLVNLTTVFNAGDRRRYEQELLAARDEARKAAEDLERLNGELEARVTRAVEERLSAEEALRQAQKMEAIGQLTGGVAHDFNNLLTLVIGGLDMIERALGNLPPSGEANRIRRARDAAMEGARRAAKLTAHLLAFSRRQPLAPKVIQVNRMVGETSELLRRTLGEQTALETILAGGLWRTEVDPVQLENALLNLAVNARDAMPDGGRLTIETQNAMLDEAYVEQIVEAVPAGQYVMIAVSDTGCGMPPETLERVFEPFFTTKDVGKGTGLGLSQVYGFVRQSGGHVRVYSEVGSGTTIKIYLPRATAAEETERTAAPADMALLRGDERILVVEDNDELRQYLCGVIEELGYRVVAAGSGPEGVAALERHPDTALLLCDVILPGGMNGRETAEAAKALRPDLKVVFMTGYTRNAIVHNGRLDRDVELISKPFSYEQLAHKLRTILDRAEPAH
jgi:PAS domain S-box-containing protein